MTKRDELTVYKIAVNVALVAVFFFLLGLVWTPYPARAACGDGTIDGTDVCDDSGTTGGDGCAVACTVEPGWVCRGEPSECTLSGNLETTAHKTLLAFSPWLVFVAFFAGCWGWPLRRRT